MNGAAVNCPLCAASATVRVGPVADGDYFAGRVLPLAIPGGLLWRCGQCHSLFKPPPLPAARYAQLYAQGRAEQWSGSLERRDFELVLDSLVRCAPRGVVLDVGCGTGDFLCRLPAGYERCGIEPSTAAAAQARARGVRIVADDLSTLDEHELFDVITLIDVIEHSLDPVRMLRDAVAHLRPGGSLLVSTGDPDSRAWKAWFGARFWYSSFPEHLVFPSARFFEGFGAQAGAPLQQRITFRYYELGLARRLAGFLVQAAYAASPALFSAAGRLIEAALAAASPRRRCFSPGVPGVFLDHHLLVLRRSG